MLLTPWTTRRGRTLVNVHTRTVPGPAARSAELLDALPTPQGPWPRDRWWPLELSEGLTLGSRGGHGPVRYAVTAVEPGRSVTFGMSPRMPFTAWHRFDLVDLPDGVGWRHTLEAEDGPFVRLLVLPLHDALLEDLLDSAAAVASGAVPPGAHPDRRPFTRRHRLQRGAAARMGRRPLP